MARLLLTGAASPLGRRLLAALQRDHELRTTDETPLPAGADSPDHVVGDLRDRELASRLVAGREALVHLAPIAPPPGLSPSDRLDRATRGTYNLLLAAIAAGVPRFVLGSSLRLFERCPAHWRVVESWAPRPTTQVEDLAPYLAEVTCREVARVSPLWALCLRFGQVVDPSDPAAGRYDPRWVHVADALQAVERALAVPPPAEWPQNGWAPYHVVAAGPRSRLPLGAAGQPAFGYAPAHDFRERWAEAAPDLLAEPPVAPPAPRAWPAHQPPQRVVVYGAGGPLAAAATEVLVRDRTLRLTDLRPLAEVAAGKPQSPGAPLPRVLEAPHELREVDVADARQVLDAAAGMDAIVNCSVLRMDPVEAFRVNLLGAYHVMLAAVAHGIRRVVHTGPQVVTAGTPGPFGYGWDAGVVDDVPARPGTHIYILTKLLGQEVCRIFAEEHGLEVPALLFTQFVNPANPPPEPLGTSAMSVSWADAGEAIRLGLDVPTLPGPFEVMHVLTDLPHGRFSNAKIKRVLGWRPRDDLAAHWQRPDWPGSG